MWGGTEGDDGDDSDLYAHLYQVPLGGLNISITHATYSRVAADAPGP